MDEDPSLR
jgi:hypothetical protein